MTLLIASQIIFNFVISLAVIVFTVWFSVIAYDVVRCSKTVKKFFDGIAKESSELYEKINKFVEGISNLSFISKFFKKRKSK